jgi:hypothetical protein
MEAPTVEAATARTKPALVTVALTITDENGNTQTEKKSIPGGPAKVTDLKAELGVPAESGLWVIAKSGKKKQLGDHETHNVKQDDRYEALVRGGVS